jgi:hypothetical protein
MLTKAVTIEQIRAGDDGSVTVFRTLEILEDGIRIAGPIAQRATYNPGDDVSGEDKRVQAVCMNVWEVVAEDRTRKQAPKVDA